MGFDFPTSPAVNDKYPVTPVPGLPTYVWDGEKWGTLGSAVGVVRYDTAQTLNDSQQLQARQNIYAAPFDAMAYSGMQINGSMEVTQEVVQGTGIPASSGAKYICDGIGMSLAGATGEGGTTAITDLPGFTTRLYFGCTAANPLAGAGDYQQLYCPIEGYRWARLAFGTANAQPVTIGFWIKPPITGTMAVGIRATAQTRSYVVDVPVTAAVWQYKTVTIPGDVIGTWNNTNGVGAHIMFGFGSGSTYKTAANIWTAGNFFNTPATSNFFATLGNTISLTGLVVLPGIQAPTAAQSPLLMRPYDQELQLCLRYYYKHNSSIVTQAPSAGFAIGDWLMHPVLMRAAPTMSATGGAFFNCTSPFIDFIAVEGARIYINTTAGGAVQASNLIITADARL